MPNRSRTLSSKHVSLTHTPPSLITETGTRETQPSPKTIISRERWRCSRTRIAGRSQGIFPKIGRTGAERAAGGKGKDCLDRRAIAAEPTVDCSAARGEPTGGPAQRSVAGGARSVQSTEHQFTGETTAE